MILDTNLKNRASSQYLNFDFNSACLFNGSILGAGDSGLFKLTGDMDNTVNIPAYFEVCETDLGVSNPKRLRAVYMSYESTTPVVMTISTETPDSVQQTIVFPSTGGENKVKKEIVSRGLHGSYFTFHVGNGSAGGFFAIEYIQIVPISRTHRRDH